MGSTIPTLPRKNALEVGIDPSRFGYERAALPIGPSLIPATVELEYAIYKTIILYCTVLYCTVR